MWTRRLDQQKGLDAYLKRSFVGTGAGAGTLGHQYSLRRAVFRSGGDSHDGSGVPT